MTEFIIYGRGGQGGVTLAKLIATTYFLRGKYAQAFGLYAAERSGAPLQAFVRIDDEEITNHNQISEPDHVIVLDRTLIGPHVLSGLKPGGWVLLNTPDVPEAFADLLLGRQVATIDATSIAVENGLGTRSVPIVNTTILGAVARLLELDMSSVEAALAHVKFGGANVAAARLAFDTVQSTRLPGTASAQRLGSNSQHVAGLLDDEVGEIPRIKTGSWATSQPQRQRLTPPYNHNCPAGNDVQKFVQQASEENYDAALRTLLETSPFPGICGRVCPAPCMDACNRRVHDEAVNVRDLERFVADHARAPEPTKPSREERIAIVGSGPAGLSAAYHLARLGYPVTLLEAGSELGGLMRTGIPAYRLPRDVLDREISFVLRHGVTVRTGVFVNRDRLLTLTHEFAAVCVSTGLQELRSLDLGSAAGDAVVQGIEFLDRVRRGEEALGGQRVVVIGGGNTAVDAARSARRIGAKSVQILYRRTRGEMPAILEEIEDALEEGIALDELVSPLRIRPDGVGQVLTCVRMRLGEPDSSGRPRPVPLTSENAHFEVACDRVILAAGQSPDLSILPEGSEIRNNGALRGLTGAPVFIGGDLATNDGTVTAAIGSGRLAALHIHKTLSGEDLESAPTEPIATPDVITMHSFAYRPSERSLTVPARVRRDSFAEVRLGLMHEPGHHAAALEAQRCFSCGVCNQCDLCKTYCPEGIVRRDGDVYRFDYDYCKGCGICASQCPRGVIYMSSL